MTSDHYDVVIIGSGAGGGTLAWKVAPPHAPTKLGRNPDPVGASPMKLGRTPLRDSHGRG